MNDFFPHAGPPREVASGLKARSKRGAIGQSWWSERFLEVLKSFMVGGRLDRGKNYARRGQVIDLDVAAGSVTARVQGTRATPYKVRLKMTVFSADDWRQIEHALAQRAWYSAKLLAGEMPDEIEDVFAQVGLPLFPTSGRDLSMTCSCPDDAVPCKHLAAVCYLLAEAFDDDPFEILAWRGRDRAQLLENLSALRGADQQQPAQAQQPTAPSLAEQLETFWQWQTEPTPPRPAHTRPDAVLDQLPPVDITVRGKPLPDLLRPAYLIEDEAQ